MKFTIGFFSTHLYLFITGKLVFLFIAICGFTIKRTEAQNLQLSLDTLVSKYVALNWSGVLLVGNGDTILYHKPFGYANRDALRPMQKETLFKTESVGKMFTGVRIMQLLSENKLTLTSTVAELLPDWNIPQAAKIQVQHLLTHSSGLTSPWEHPDFTFGTIYTKEELKKIIETAPVSFAVPGTKKYYSNSAFMLLEEIIARRDHQTFESSIKEHIFKPAGMYNTSFLNDSILPIHAATPYYQISSNQFVKDDTRYGDGKASGAGGWMSTAKDLYLFAKAYVTEKLLNSEWMKMQTSNNFSLTEASTDFRYGFQVLRGAPANTFIIGHNGGGKGFSIDVYFDAASKNIVVFCSNTYGSGYALTQKVFNLLNHQRYPEPSHSARVKLADWLLQQKEPVNITDSILKNLSISEASDYLFFNVFDNLALAHEHKAAKIMITACRERFPLNVYSWMRSGENATALNNTEEAKLYFQKAYALAKEQKNEELLKIIRMKLE